jgi:hypothetical protein
MSIKSSIDFLIALVGDGVSTSVELPLSSSPFLLVPGSFFQFFNVVTPAVILPASFSLGHAQVSSVENVRFSIGTGITISSASIDSTGTLLSVSFSGALPIATEYAIAGTFVF